jgi:WhiB family redox-sensing transcriptional regulator
MISTEHALALAAALLAHSEERYGHRVWIGDNNDTIRRDGTDYTFRRAAHTVRHGYLPLGQVRTTCGVAQCFIHTTDLGLNPDPTTTPTVRDPGWHTRAACAKPGVNDRLFFPEDHRGPSEVIAADAKRVCARCPVRAHCLDSALAEEGGIGSTSRYGVRGGLTGRQRHREYVRRRTAAQAAV